MIVLIAQGTMVGDADDVRINITFDEAYDLYMALGHALLPGITSERARNEINLSREIEIRL